MVTYDELINLAEKSQGNYNLGAEVRISRFPRVPNIEHPDCPVNVAGRYFGYSDPRHKLHALSTRILTSKKKPEGQAGCFADLFMRGAWLASAGSIDFVTRVPARPGDTDRLLLYLNELPNTNIFKTQNLNTTILRPDVLQCIVKYPKLKTLNYQQRKVAVKGAFQANPDVADKRVILLDDVQTTGATLNECIRVLKAAGAQSIFPIVLGYHPYALQTLGLTDDHEIHCNINGCTETLIGRCNNVGSPFFGCSGWRVGQNHLTRTFLQGITQKLNLMQPHLMQMDEELQSENIGF